MDFIGVLSSLGIPVVLVIVTVAIVQLTKLIFAKKLMSALKATKPQMGILWVVELAILSVGLSILNCLATGMANIFGIILATIVNFFCSIGAYELGVVVFPGLKIVDDGGDVPAAPAAPKT